MSLHHPKILLALLLVLLLQLPLHAQFKGASDTIPEATLNILRAMPAHDYPYGAPVLMKIFPRHWRSNNRGADTASFQYRVRTYIDTLSMFVYQDFSTPDRYAVPARSMPAGQLFPAQYLSKLGLKPLVDTASLIILKIQEVGGITVYSAMAQQDIPCSGCEYQPRQLVNMLFTVAGNKVVSKLLVAYVKGDDLERCERFCYINDQGSIFIKDFLSDELEGSFLKKEEWHVTPKGFFKKDR